MDLIPKLAIRNARETFHPLFSSQKYHQRNRTLPKIVARGGDIDRGPSGDSIQEASLIGTTLVHRTCTRNNIVDKKEHTLEKRKVPSVTACTQRTHENRQTIGETFSLIHFSSPSSLYYYPFALNLYAWNEIFFLETFLSTDLRRRSHWTMETTPRTTTALNSNNPVRNRSIDSVEKDDRFKLRPRWSCIILKNNFLHFFPSPFVERESNNKIKFKYTLTLITLLDMDKMFQ